MKKEIIMRIKLIADEDKLLTNGELYAKTVFLAENESEENWLEISQQECTN